jgi:CheY-like chemotaxis protein
MGADAVAVATAGILAGPAPASDPDPPVRGRELPTLAATPGPASPTGTIPGVSEHPHAAPAPTAEPTVTVLVYSDDRTVRAGVRSALGRRPAAGLPLLEYLECATEPAVIARMDAGGIDLVILDGEAAPAGGMGICRQLKDEIYRCPPVLVLVGRPQDAWLATWSRADAVVSHPLDPIVLAHAAAGLLVTRMGLAPSPTIA